ncbi:MAG: HlyD family efflux transporter periplasmic adaptor subunit [Polyangiaceae bacterium]
MIKNSAHPICWRDLGVGLRAALLALGLGLGLSGCRTAKGSEPTPFQGVVEIEETVLAFELGGRVQEITVKEGDKVAIGQRLASLDDSLTKATEVARLAEVGVAEAQVQLLRQGARPLEIRAADSRVEAAKAVESQLSKNVERLRALLQNGAIAQASVDDADAQLQRAIAERMAAEHVLDNLKAGSRAQEIKGAKARADAALGALELERVRMRKHVLNSPLEGRVLDVHVEPGEVIGTAAAVVTIGRSREPYVDIFVPQSKMGGIKVGTPARIRIDALKTALDGKVTWVGRRTEFTPRYLFSENERSTLVLRVRVTFDDPKEELVSGVPAFVSLGGSR